MTSLALQQWAFRIANTPLRGKDIAARRSLSCFQSRPHLPSQTSTIHLIVTSYSIVKACIVLVVVTAVVVVVVVVLVSDALGISK